MLNELQTTSIASLMNAGTKVGRQGNEPAALGLTARMPVSSKSLDGYSRGFSSGKVAHRSCQSAAALVWQAQAPRWESRIPVVLSVRCDFDVASVKIALGESTHGPVSPRGDCVASAIAALRVIS